MGSGASRDGEVVDEDPQYAQKSMAPISGHRLPTGSGVQSRSQTSMHPKGSSISRNLSRSLVQTPGPSRSMDQSTVSRFIDGYEEAIVNVSRGGFSMQEITIMEGQVVTFRWDEINSLKIIQVVSDGEKLRPVIGGYVATGDECNGVFHQQFNLEGEYKFAVYGQRCTPLSVIVRRRMDLQAEVTDDGFNPELIYIDQGHAVKWLWKNCMMPHYIQEVVYCIDRGCFKKQPANTSVVATVSGSYRHQFNKPGMHFFQTESKEMGKSNMCIVHVREAQREHKIEVLDRSFQPMILLIEQGDRVWWHWDRSRCKKSHSVYQIDPPGEDHDDDLYMPTKDGFRWSIPSKQGFLSHEFHRPGVYYFSDQNFEETAEYIGTIIVKPRQQEHFVELKQKGFSPDLVYANTGDRVWWTWDGDAIVDIQENLLILEDDKCLNPVARKQSAEGEESLQVLDENSASLLTKVGMATTQFTTIGVYHFRIADTGDMYSTCSIIVNPGPKNHTVHLTDNGFEPKVLTVRPNDRVWWVWQSCKKQHNIVQVSHQGVPINNGFHSGQTRDSPSAFYFQFVTPGVYYFISANLPKIFGAIVVSTQPQVHEIAVSSHEIKPDPVTIQMNDIVCWAFRGPRSHGVVPVETVDQLLDAQFAEKTVTPRRCIAEAIRRTGTMHFYSKSFQSRKKSHGHMDESRMSSVICDERFDNAVIRIDKNGFHPSTLYIQKGQSVLWTWKGTDQQHNVIHVNSPDSEQPLNVIQGAQSFNSGKPVPNNSFLYTFDENGTFTVASQGAPGYSCTVMVLDVAPRASEPYIKSEQNGGTLNRNVRIFLASETEGASIYYTTDGTAPAEYSHTTKKYKPDQGVVLRDSGLNFVRAIAVAEGYLTSHIFTSKRFWVLKDLDGEGDKVSDESGPEELDGKTPSSGKQWNWWNCKPKLKGCFTNPGVMEIFWELPPDGAQSLVKGYQVFLNGVSYCEMFPRTNNSLNISGLAGGRTYEVFVKVYPSDPSQSDLTSNKLMMKCPVLNPDGGPVISLEVSEKPDSLSIVWMSIDTEERPVDGYIVYLNDQQCGPKLVPDPDSNRCKVVIGSCDLHKMYKIHIMALFRQSDHTRMSNVLEVELPLDTQNITLPPKDQRCDDDEMYSEYVELHEGSGYLPSMDEEIPQKSRNKIVEVETRDQGVMTDDNYEKATQTPRGRNIKLIGRRNRLNGEVEYLPISIQQGDSSSSESEAESGEEVYGSDDDDDDNRDRNVVILDVAKDQTRDYSDRFGKPDKRSKRGRKKQHQHGDQDDGDDGVVRTRPLGKPPTGRTPRTKQSNVIVEVQQVVELDVVQKTATDRDELIHKLAVPATKEDTMKQVGEGEFVLGDGDGILPAPSIMVESHGKHGVKVMWQLPKQPDPEYQLILYVVNVVGTKFTSETNSDISFECNLVEKEKPVRGVQHCWNIQGKEKCVVKGLVAGLTYRIYVIANYNLMHGQQPCEVQTSSSVIYYTTLGPPRPPKVKVVSVDLYQACIEWVPPSVHSDMKLKGFQIYVDNKPLGAIRSSDVQQMIVNNMIPGKTISVYVVAVTSRANQESEPSKTIHLSCPRRPPVVSISQQPSYKKGCVLVAWDKPHNFVSSSNEEAISLYSIYVDSRWHGEVKANKMCDQQGYQFFLTDLSPGNSYDISVKAISGTRRIDSEAQHVFCLSDSGMSNVLSVMAPAAPKSPKLRLEGLHPGGIDVTWQVPQQFGDACISGYQMLKNGKVYGSIIPPDVNSLRISDVSLGEKLSLQLIALTEHPVGKDTRQSLDLEKDSGIDGVSQPDEKPVSASTSRISNKFITFDLNGILTSDWPTVTKDIFTGDRYTGCKPGQPLVVHYTGLVQAPLEVWCEMVSGHSALIVWNTEHSSKAHFVRPDCYQVTWWPGDTAQDDINSDSTEEDHLLITNLRPCTAYTVIVEARKMEKYTDMDEGSSMKETPDGLNAFILTAKSEQLAIKTASPPDPPRNLGVVATTCNSLKVAWDQPLEHGVEVIGIHLECISLNTNDPHHINVDVMPDSKDASIENLHEKTDYLIRVIAVTEEYFDRLPDKHRHKRLHAIPRDSIISPDDSPWLPNSSVLAKTAGTEPPANLKVVKATRTSLTISWTPPLVYGSNKLQSQIVRWADLKRNQHKDEDLVVASHVNLLATEDSLVIEDLSPGVQYRVVVEAIVSIKTSLDREKWDSGIEKYRRTAHVMSAPLLARTRAPIEPPQVLVMSYTENTANLYWEKPQLMSLVGKDEEGNPEYLRRYLEGYKLEVNGKLQCCLGPSAQSCTLTKCRPGKLYEVALVAMTCTEEVKKQRKMRYRGFFKNTDPQDLDYTAILQDEDDLDESPSDPVEVILPRHQDGFLSTLTAEFEYQAERDNKTFGDVIVSWTCQGGHTNLLKQFSIVWYCQDDRVIQTRYVNPEQTSCTIPITRIKSVYNITVEPVYYTDVIAQPIQSVQIMIPGPPDAPEIFLKSVEPEEFIIEWGEPKLFGGVKIKAYQVYLNDKKAGNELSSSHRKAVIPCRANRTYKVHLVALSSNAQFGDSPKSNTLLINTSTGSPRPGDSMLEDWSSVDEHEIPLKITKVTENSITLDWSGFLDTEGVAYYKIQWSSVAQPAQREVRLSEKDSNCVINKCLPGTTHFVRLVACKDDGQIVDKSKQLTMQTSAPPDSPVVSVRACNFRYIAVQWDKANTYGEALVTGYKVYVNGIVEAVLTKDQLNYTYTHGKWCHEYAFQVQALTACERLNSKPSEPLIIPWPGAKAPAIYRIPSVSSSSLRVGWEEPYATEGVKVKHYKLCCVEEDTEKVIQSIGPIHPDTREAEFKHLKKGNYCVYLEVHLYGTSDVVRSDMIRMQPALSPDPPHITATIVGLEERRQIEKFTCDLVNKRDRLIRAVGHKLKKIGALAHPVRAEKSEDVILGAHTLTRVEEMLEDCFNALENYTGQLIAHVSWQCTQRNPDMLVTGYKVLIDGKQYGNAMHSGIKTVRIKLGLEQPSYKLAMVSLSDKPQGASEESNIVELLSTPFKPFVFYCYHAIHNKDKVWPQYGCCKFQDSIGYERQVGKKLANQGMLQKHVPPPSCSLLDIFDGEYKPLMNFHRRQHPTILLFWTPWCLSSGNLMTHFTRFARDNAKEVNAVAVTCGLSAIGAAERKSLIHTITSNGWREDGVVWHVTSECASSIYEATNNILRTSEGLRLENRAEQERKVDLTELLGIAGVPTFLFIHPDGYIAWHGRYSAFDYASFTAFMRHTISEVVASPCPVYNCDCCQNDMAFDEEIFTTGILSPENRNSSKNVTIRIGETEDIPPPVTGSKHSPTHEMKYAAINGYTENIGGTERVFLRRRSSPNRSKKRTKITVNMRPFSASASSLQLHNSPYLARLRPSSPVRSRSRPSSSKRLNYYV
ncbi:uncharacterized protein LOC121367568 [Gigantopelta aegis]|uniref:uncharacterized protein LOC121367568 n=1 Tax=Gigantopelta aegis TaxID=1735272 RepID=UPI001B889C22|nr:uncharacterized protein LOC121367568 [Gigantopelta aegis]